MGSEYRHTNLPLNVRFQNEDWGAVKLGGGAGSHSGISYDVILALSVIKWLHLEHCDEGTSLSLFCPSSGRSREKGC